MENLTLDELMMWSLRTTAIASLDLKALMDLAPHVEATGMTFEEHVACYREISAMTPDEKAALAEVVVRCRKECLAEQQQMAVLIAAKIADKSAQLDE